MPSADVRSEGAEAATGCLDADRHVCVDMPCLNCGYNLRTLAYAGKCPECGDFVARAADCYAGRSGRWLCEAQEGAWGLTVCSGALLLLAGLAPLHELLTDTYSGWLSAPLILAGLGLIVLVLYAPVFLFAFSVRLPNRSSRGERWSARRLVRVSAVTPLVGIVLNLGAVLVSALVDVGGTDVSEIAPVAAMALGGAILVLVLPPALCGHARTLMKRIGRDRLARSASATCWIELALEIVLVAGIVLWQVDPPGLRSWSDVAADACVGAVVAMLLAMFVLLLRVARALGAAQREYTERSAV